MKVAGRLEEIKIMQGMLGKSSAEFVAVYGRRRIGKTYLIRQVYADNIAFECSGLHQKDFAQQLENFWLAIVEADKGKKPPALPKTWLQAFALLKTYLNELPAGKKVIFLDEVSWFETPRSGFLAALDNFWNQYCSKRSDVILVICGSAASWIIKKVINDRGGLHNRITKRIQLQPFTLSETKEFLALQQVSLTYKDITQLYMSVGGIPFYLKDVQPGQSVPQILDQLFFNSQAPLKEEFDNLYAALFKNSQLHESIVKALAAKNKGLTRTEITEETGIKSGGNLTILLDELVQCGFVTPIFPYKKSKEDVVYRLVDEYTIFYYKFLYRNKTNSSWLQVMNKPAYKIWCGYAFESVCFKHITPIKKALGINGIISHENSWIKKGTKDETGTQIDLLIDRDDNCINLLEIKFYNGPFEVTKAYAAQLMEKAQIFKQTTGTRKNIFITLLTVYGAKKNEHYLGTITNEVEVEKLFV